MPIPNTKALLGSTILAGGGYSFVTNAPGDLAPVITGAPVPSFVAGIGDLDGDGRADFIFGAPGDDDKALDAGRVFVSFGIVDFVIGPAGNEEGGANSGAVYVVWGGGTGTTGNDTLDGAAGADTLIGGAGDDTYLIDRAADVIAEAARNGTDTVVSSLDYTLGDRRVRAVIVTKTLTSAVIFTAPTNDHCVVSAWPGPMCTTSTSPQKAARARSTPSPTSAMAAT